MVGILRTGDAVAVGRLVCTGCGSASPTCCSSDRGIHGSYVLSSEARRADVGREEGQGEGQRKGKGNDEVHG